MNQPIPHFVVRLEWKSGRDKKVSRCCSGNCQTIGSSSSSSSSSTRTNSTNNTSTMPDSIQENSHDDHFGPLAIVPTAQSHLPAFASELQPGLHRAGPIEKGQLGNPAPLGLAGFALTTFVLGCINMGARDVSQPNMVVGVAFAYGGLVQLCAGMW